MKAGSAWVDITPSEPLNIAGQMDVRNGEYVHDPLTVNAVVFAQEDTRVALVSCDLCLMPDDLAREIQGKCEEAYGIPASSVLISCTHTHVAPMTSDTLLVGKTNPAFLQKLTKSIVDAIGQALENMEDVELYAGAGWIDQMGFNRRGYHADGSVDMYYGCWNDDFSGLEGPRDGEVGVIFAERPDGSLKFVIPSFSTHPNSLESESFYSADVVGAVRNHIRMVLGKDVDVIYLTGAAGDTAPSDLESKEQYWRGEEGWKRSGMYLGSEIVKVIASTTKPMADPELKLVQSIEKIPIREYNDIVAPDWLGDYFLKAKADWPRMLKEESPVDVRISVIRIGDAAICTNPAELYVAHGLTIKKGSPAKVTLVSELCDGCVGYVPTKEAFTHGGYSTYPVSTSKLSEDAGDIISATTIKHLKSAF